MAARHARRARGGHAVRVAAARHAGHRAALQVRHQLAVPGGGGRVPLPRGLPLAVLRPAGARPLARARAARGGRRGLRAPDAAGLPAARGRVQLAGGGRGVPRRPAVAGAAGGQRRQADVHAAAQAPVRRVLAAAAAGVPGGLPRDQNLGRGGVARREHASAGARRLQELRAALHEGEGRGQRLAEGRAERGGEAGVPGPLRGVAAELRPAAGARSRAEEPGPQGHRQAAAQQPVGQADAEGHLQRDPHLPRRAGRGVPQPAAEPQLPCAALAAAAGRRHRGGLPARVPAAAQRAPGDGGRARGRAGPAARRAGGGGRPAAQQGGAQRGARRAGAHVRPDQDVQVPEAGGRAALLHGHRQPALPLRPAEPGARVHRRRGLRAVPRPVQGGISELSEPAKPPHVCISTCRTSTRTTRSPSTRRAGPRTTW